MLNFGRPSDSRRRRSRATATESNASPTVVPFESRDTRRSNREDGVQSRVPVPADRTRSPQSDRPIPPTPRRPTSTSRSANRPAPRSRSRFRWWPWAKTQPSPHAMRRDTPKASPTTQEGTPRDGGTPSRGRQGLTERRSADPSSRDYRSGMADSRRSGSPLRDSATSRPEFGRNGNEGGRSPRLSRPSAAKPSPLRVQSSRLGTATTPSTQKPPSSSTARTSRPTPETDRNPQRNRRPTAPSPLLYGVRLLILVVGIGAIAGTMLSTLNPNLRNSPASPLANVVAAQDPFAQSAANSRDLASSLLSLQLNQPINPLGQDITELAGSVSDLTAGVFLVDLDTGNYLDVNGTTPFSAASMIKVPVLIAFFQEVDAGRISLDEVLTMTEADRAGGSGDMQFDAEGSQYTALETATKMIIISDNTATNMLIRRMGGIDAVNQRFQSWGLDNTHIQNLLPDLEGTNLTTPRELVELMAMVSRGDLVSLRSRDRLLDIMRRTQTSTLIPAGVGDPRATIAHKTGDIGSMVGDVGIVDMPTGQRYSIAVMVKRPHNDSRAQDLIRQINAEIYQYLLNPPTPETVPPTTPSTTPPD